MDPCISIIIPVYNVELYLEKCIESVINQTYKNLEIILIDDGSPDHCGEICEQFALKDKRIRVIHKENGGLSSARNIGLELFTGDYIGFVDSDDWIENSMYERLLEKAIEVDASIVQCGYQIMTMDGRIKRKHVFRDEVFITNQLILDAYFSQTNIHVVVWNKLYKRNLFENVRMVEGRLYEDTMASIEIMLQCNRFASIEGVYYNYLFNINSITKSSFTPKKMDAIFAANYVLEKCKTYSPRYINHCHILSCLYCLHLFYELQYTSNNEYILIFKKIIVEEFNLHLNVIKRSKEFRNSRINNRILILGFRYNKWIIFRILRLYNYLRCVF